MFFGRQDVLKTIKEVLVPDPNESETGALRTYALCGLGGVGKTEIAVEFTFSQKAEFDAIFWIYADSTSKIREGYSQVASELELGDPLEANDQVASANLVKSWLTKPYRDPDEITAADEPRWLMILDNADNLDDLRDYWPQYGRGSILITSRDPQAKQNAHNEISGIDLPCFNDEDAAEFLLQRTHQESLEPALAVARKLGGLPLGLMQMAGIINHKDYTLDEFLRKYEERRLGELFNLKPGWQPHDYGHTVASVWALDQLDERSTGLLEVISLLDPDGIPEELLTKGAESKQLAHYPSTDDDYETSRIDLTRRSLISRNKEAQQLRVHRLTQDTVRAKMGFERLQSVFSYTTTLVSAIWPYAPLGQRHQTARWQTCDSLIPHVLRLYELYGSFKALHKYFAAEATFARLLTDSAW